jgi:hypothetical protein
MTMARLWPFFDQFAGGFVPVAEYDPVWLRCLEATVDAIKTLAGDGRLPGIDADSVILLEQPLVSLYFGTDDAGNSLLSYPGIIVWPWSRESVLDFSNLREEIGYPVAVSFVDKGAGSTGTSAMVASRAKIRQHMLWREKVSRRFRKAVWSEIAEIEQSSVRPDVYAIPDAYKNADLFHGATIIDFQAFEGRDAE